MQGEEEDEQMVRHRLEVAVKRMESMGSKGGRNCKTIKERQREPVTRRRTEPLVVWFVNVLVNRWMV
jgi:hypothetical protein